MAQEGVVDDKAFSSSMGIPSKWFLWLRQFGGNIPLGVSERGAENSRYANCRMDKPRCSVLYKIACFLSPLSLSNNYSKLTDVMENPERIDGII